MRMRITITITILIVARKLTVLHNTDKRTSKGAFSQVSGPNFAYVLMALMVDACFPIRTPTCAVGRECRRAGIAQGKEDICGWAICRSLWDFHCLLRRCDDYHNYTRQQTQNRSCEQDPGHESKLAISGSICLPLLRNLKP